MVCCSSPGSVPALPPVSAVRQGVQVRHLADAPHEGAPRRDDLPGVRQGAEPHRAAAQPHAEPTPGADAAPAPAPTPARTVAPSAAAVEAALGAAGGVVRCVDWCEGEGVTTRKRHCMASFGRCRAELLRSGSEANM